MSSSNVSGNLSGASAIPIQTRYSFYDAGSMSADSLLEPSRSPSGSKSEDAVTVTTTGSDEENNGNANGFVGNANANAGGSRGGSGKKDKRKDATGTATGSAHGKHSTTSTSKSDNVDGHGLFAPILSGKSVESATASAGNSEVEVEAEAEALAGEQQKTGCVVIGKPPMYERGVSNVTEDTIAMTMTSPDTKSYDTNMTTNKKEDTPQNTSLAASGSASASASASNIHEKLIREALHHIRRRGQERDANANANTNTNNVAGGNSNSNSIHPSIEGVVPVPGLALESSSSSLVANASKLDNRLLSPPADVRKAASDMNIYRHNYNCTNTNTHTSTSTEVCDSAIAENGETTFTRLELAKPVFSTPGQETETGTGHDPKDSNDSNSNKRESGGTSSPTQKLDFSVVPSSPAPGKFQSLAMDVVKKNEHGSIQKSRQVQLEMERRTRREMEVERGVEQVLLAILQRAHAGDDGGGGNGGSGGGGGGGVSSMDSFLSEMFRAQSLVPEIGGHGRIMRPMRVDSVDQEEEEEIDSSGKNMGKQAQAQSQSQSHSSRTTDKLPTAPSAVEQLLEENSQVDDAEIDELSSAFHPITLDPKGGEGQVDVDVDVDVDVGNNDESFEEPIPLQPELPDDTGVTRTSIRPFSSDIDGILEVEAVERVSRKEPDIEDERVIQSDEEDDDDEEEEACDDMVLGPLSKEMGGTTGVVLQNDDDDDDDDEAESGSQHDCEAEELQDPVSPSSISSVTNTGRQKSNIMAKLSFGSGTSVDDDANETLESSYNREKEFDESFVKDLYSHMLVRHPSQKHVKSTTRKEEVAGWISDQIEGTTNTSNSNYCWDDEDIDEPGYLMHTFTRSTLHDIENDYESIVDRLKSEYDTAVTVKKPPSTRRKTKGSDFEHDLNEVEKLLDKRGKLKKKQLSAKKRKGQKNQAGSKKSSSTSNPANSSLATNPLFPGAKAAGTGEVGDLEIYHLPIIYKAHQTGFEPTKDLVLQPDTVFAGQYYVQSELGSAAFSTAYRCVDLNSGKKAEDDEIYYDEVCLKVIKNTKDFFDQSLDEIKILELLRQTNECSENNILEMKAFFYHKEHLIIVTELLRQNLFEFGKYITEHDEPVYFTRSRLCYIARQCLVALSFVHKLGLVHSDIKPENILLASYSRARVKVIDFGSSCYLTDRQSSYIQSRSYRAPEVVLGLPYDGKIDVWSLGCVIAEMYTGQVTFQNDSVVTMLSRIEAICGAFPRYMIEEGHQSGQFFTPSGLLYEKVENDDDSGVRMDTSTSFADDDSAAAESALFTIFQPKTTTMAERLGFNPDLLNRKRKTWEEEDSFLFVDFVTKLLTIDPDKRPTADEALEHPWILAGFNLSEEDLKYPPE